MTAWYQFWGLGLRLFLFLPSPSLLDRFFIIDVFFWSEWMGWILIGMWWWGRGKVVVVGRKGSVVGKWWCGGEKGSWRIPGGRRRRSSSSPTFSLIDSNQRFSSSSVGEGSEACSPTAWRSGGMGIQMTSCVCRCVDFYRCPAWDLTIWFIFGRKQCCYGDRWFEGIWRSRFPAWGRKGSVCFYFSFF